MAINTPVMKATGYTGTLEVYENGVRIIYDDLSLGIITPPTELLYSDIDSIEFRYNKGDSAGHGFIRFSQNEETPSINSDSMDIMADRTVCFTKNTASKFKEVEWYIKRKMLELYQT